MEHNNLIYDYLDGELTAESEDALFSLISSDSSARVDFKKHIALDNALKNDCAKLSPSSKSTFAIFSQLGFTPPIELPVQQKKYGFFKAFAEFYYFHKNVIRASLASSLATALLVLYFLPGGVLFKKSQFMLGANEFLGLTKNSQADVTRVLPPSDNRNMAGGPSIIANKRLNLTNDKNNSHNTFVAQKQESGFERGAVQLLPEIQESSVFVKTSNEFSLANGRNFANNDNNSFNTMNRKRLGLVVSVSGNYGIPLHNVNLSQPADNMLNTAGVNIAYMLGESIAVEADFRREYFHQEYEERRLGVRNKVEQYPNLSTIGVGARYYFAKEGKFTAYGNLQAGANNAGIVGRAGVSLEFSPSPEYKIVVGLESSRLAYNKDNNLIYTDKIGLNYGLAFNF